MSSRAGDRWHQPLVHVRAGELRADTGQTPGMTRLEAISATTSSCRPTCRTGKRTPVPARPVVIIARSSQEAIVVSLDSLWPVLPLARGVPVSGLP